MPRRAEAGSLQLEQDPRFHRAQARLSSATWAALIALMLAAGLGVFGNGLLSRTRAGRDGGLVVEYDRFGRFGASMQMVVHPDTTDGDAVELAVGQSLLDGFQVVAVKPEPDSSAIVAGGVRFRFPAQTTGPVTFHLQPVRRWRITGSVWSSRSSVSITQFIYP